MALKTFIETEFTDCFDPHLISLGMAAEFGNELYREVPYPDSACSAFVREAVIPLLGRLPNSAYPRDELGVKVMTSLEFVRPQGDEVKITFPTTVLSMMPWQSDTLFAKRKIRRA